MILGAEFQFAYSFIAGVVAAVISYSCKNKKQI